MDLHLFFKHEGSVSALLASMLDQYPDFLEAFFDNLQLGDRVKQLKARTWNVEVEVHGLDILLTSKDAEEVIIIENKIRPGSVQKGQLSKYYVKALESLHPPRIGVVYVAPGPALGEAEVEAVTSLIAERGRKKTDWVARMSWTDLQDMVEQQLKKLRGSWAEHFVGNALEQIMLTIKNARQVKWPAPEGSDRRIVLEMANSLREALLEKFPRIQVGRPWPSKTTYTLATAKTNITMWLILLFTAKETEPYDPDDWRINGSYKLTLKALVKLSATGRRDRELRDQWNALREKGITVPVLGQMTPADGEWLAAQREIAETKEGLLERGKSVGESLLRIVQEFSDDEEGSSR